MGNISTNAQLTYVETAKRISPQGELMTIVEVLAELNEIVQDIPMIEANDRFVNKTLRRGQLPTGSWRKLNAGVSAESSQTIEMVDGMGFLESYSEPDKDIIDSMPNPAQARSDEDMGFVEGLGQTLASAIIYSNSYTDPEQPHGMAPRLSSLAATTNVIGEGGTGSDLTSVFMVKWGLREVHGIYPRGMTGNLGIQKRDLGERTKTDSNGKSHQIYRTHFKVNFGLVVKDPKCYARLANIETSGSSNTFDEDNIITLKNRMRGRGKGAYVYCNDTIQSQMEIAAKDKANIFYSFAQGEGLFGGEVMKAKQMPIRGCDAIINTESALT
jgi:hypothetical protein